jgi:hypothetical protein
VFWIDSIHGLTVNDNKSIKPIKHDKDFYRFLFVALILERLYRIGAL